MRGSGGTLFEICSSCTSSNHAVPVAMPQPPKRQFTWTEEASSASNSTSTRVQSLSPVSARVAIPWRPCRFRRAPRPPPAALTFSVLIQPERRYRANGSIGAVAAQPQSAPSVDEIWTLRLPVRPVSAYPSVPRPFQRSRRQPRGPSRPASSKEALGIRFGAAGGSSAGTREISTANATKRKTFLMGLARSLRFPIRYLAGVPSHPTLIELLMLRAFVARSRHGREALKHAAT